MSLNASFSNTNKNNLSPSIFTKLNSANKSDYKNTSILESIPDFEMINTFYNKEDSIFRKKIDKLNLKFYLESDKFINLKQDLEKAQDNLFLLMYKQITIYLQEIELLNKKLKLQDEKSKIKECVKYLNLIK